MADTQMGLVSEIYKIQSLGNKFFNCFLILSSIDNLNNSCFLHKNCSKFHEKLVANSQRGLLVLSIYLKTKKTNY